MSDPDRDATALRRLYAAVSERPPLVHCVTNVVAANFSANTLLALGASPAMVEDPEEAAELAAHADALVVNTGTMNADRAEGMRRAAGAARDAAVPWLLDPVAVGVVSLRTRVARELADLRPTVVRGNASEIPALTGAGLPGRGVDAVAEVADAADAATRLAATRGPVVAVSGERDLVTDGTVRYSVRGGDPVMGRVTAMGCALGAVMGAFLAASRRTGDTALDAVLAASAVVGACGSEAARHSGGPGSFVPAWLDRLAAPDLAAAEALVGPAD